jgi:hypothetical protein
MKQLTDKDEWRINRGIVENKKKKFPHHSYYRADDVIEAKKWLIEQIDLFSGTIESDWKPGKYKTVKQLVDEAFNI